MSKSSLTIHVNSHRYDRSNISKYKIVTEFKNNKNNKVEQVVVYRRFSEFHSLHKQLRKDGYNKDVYPVSLPSRVWDTDPSLRLSKLEIYLQKAALSLAPNEVTKSTIPLPFLKFLDISDKNFGKKEDNFKVEYGTPIINEKYKEKIDSVFDEILKIEKIKDGENGWKKIGSNKNFQWLAHPGDKNTPGNRKVEGIIKRCPPRMLHNLFFDVDVVKKMESNINTIETVEKIDEHTTIEFCVMKSIMFMGKFFINNIFFVNYIFFLLLIIFIFIFILACRDVCMLRHWRVLEDGTIVHVEFSVETDKSPPIGDKGRVRATLTVGGCIIRKVEGDPNSSQFCRINNMDPQLGDAVPDYALNQVNEFTSSMLAKNFQILEKLVLKKNPNKILAKGPLVNHNGNVIITGDLDLDDENNDNDNSTNSLEIMEVYNKLSSYINLRDFALGIVVGLIIYKIKMNSNH